MKTHLKIKLLFTVLLLAVGFANAQKIQGVISDSTSGEVLPYATITTFNQERAIIGGAITDQDGEFNFPLTDEVEVIEIAHLGYVTKVIKKPFDFGKRLIVSLNTDNEVLAEVVVEGEKTNREFLIDRKVINFGNDLQTAGGTVMEAFEQLPEIETDPVTQSISLRGNANVRILVNGKPSPLNNADLLAQIDAIQVEKVEIITSPSAKYQADGASGIVNIILKDKVIKGIAGSVSLEGRSNPAYSTGANLTGGFGKFNLQANARYRDSYSISRSSNLREIVVSDQRQMVNTEREFDGTVENLSLKADWFINSNNDLSLSFTTTNNEHFITPETTIEQIGSLEVIKNELINFHRHQTKIYNINYRKRFQKNIRYIDFDVNLNENKNTLPSTALANDQLVLDNELFYNNEILNMASDLFWTFNDHWIMEAGLLYTEKKIDNQQSTLAIGGQLNQLSYVYDEYTYASYVLLKHNADKLGVQLGLRSEYFTSSGTINGEVNAIEREFWNVFPSFHLSYKKSEKLNYSVGYNRRISRPSFYALNPLTTINDPLYRREGNPELIPSFTDNIELGIQYNSEEISVNSSLYYRRTSDILNRVFEIDNDITVMKFSNGGEDQTLGIENTISKDVSSKVAFSLTTTGYYKKANPEILDFYYENQYNYRFRPKLTYRASKKFSADIQWNYFGSGRRLNTASEDFNFLNLAMRYKMLKNKGTLSFRFNDVFRSNIYQNRRRSNQLTEQMRWLGQTRIAVLSFTYRFSQGDVKKRKQARKNYNESGALE